MSGEAQSSARTEIPETETEGDALGLARDATLSTMEECIEEGGDHLIDSLPAMGKSYSSMEVPHTTGKYVTYLTPRGNEESYEERRKHAEDRGLKVKVLPSLNRDCPCARGDHGEEIQQRVMDLQSRGVSGREIHKQEDLPCTDDGRCPWSEEWDFEADDFDVLIGHYSHAYVPKVTVENRVTIVDEFPPSFETQFGGDSSSQEAPLAGVVTTWLSDEVSAYDSYNDLIENRHESRDPEGMNRMGRNESSRQDRIIRFIEEAYGEIGNEGGGGQDTTHAFATETGHASAPLVVYTILAGEREGKTEMNGVERVPLGSVTGVSGSVGVFDHRGKWSRDAEPGVYILDPPKIESETIIGVDGTPTPAMWDAAMGIDMEYHQVLSDAERRHYINSADGLGITLVGCTDAVRPYNNPDNVNLDYDRTVVEHIRETHDEKPGLVTTTTAMSLFEQDDLLDEFDLRPPEEDDGRQHSIYYGNLLGSNKYKNKSVGYVSGSTNYGDGFVEQWATYIGEEATLPDRDANENWADVESGIEGSVRFLTHMRENQTLQAIMRFGRQGNGCTVYVNTSAVPDWIEFDREIRARKVSNRMGEVVVGIMDLENPFTISDVADSPLVDVSKRTVKRSMRTLTERELIEKHKNSGAFSPNIYSIPDPDRLVEAMSGTYIDQL